MNDVYLTIFRVDDTHHYGAGSTSLFEKGDSMSIYSLSFTRLYFLSLLVLLNTACIPGDTKAVSLPSSVQESGQDEELKIPKVDPEELKKKIAEQQDFHLKQIELLTSQPEQDSRSKMDLAGHHFMAAQFDQAVAKYDEVIEMIPAYQPQLWQRGLSLYYADKFQLGVQQFETHQTVNSQDVENSVWHLLCAARVEGLEQARKGMIDIYADMRVPMREIHQLFAGKTSPAAVVAAAEKAIQPTTRQYQLYYAYLYLGLYFEMIDQPEKALGCLENAVLLSNMPVDQLMGQVARVHYQLRTTNQKEHFYFHREEKPEPHTAKWSYEGDTGPENWGKLCPEYRVAETGKRQSPIDIRGFASQSAPSLEFAYRPALTNLVYDGHTIKETDDDEHALKIDEQVFSLKQFHFHSPSEHKIEGQAFDMEMHLVHKNEAGQVAVVGIMISKGSENKAFQTLLENLPTAENKKRESNQRIDVQALLPENQTYFHYTGSFTTPPCTEGVLWYVLETPIELSESQIQKFREIINGNNRPVQPLHDRKIVKSQ